MDNEIRKALLRNKYLLSSEQRTIWNRIVMYEKYLIAKDTAREKTEADIRFVSFLDDDAVFKDAKKQYEQRDEFFESLRSVVMR